MEYIEDMEDETLMESLYSELSYMASHPLELNGGVTEEELQKLPFLSDNQIQGLLSYVKRHGPMLTVYELKNVEELDFQTIKLLLPFVYVSGKAVDKRPLTVNNLLAYG
ncbi:MAG: helix-hairpin-helix domain-containing protein, partial [Tannerellaceae bacterium]|nr:helix-hairpin-helix domain-containing protein [Tannerellaceae bacterium]